MCTSIRWEGDHKLLPPFDASSLHFDSQDSLLVWRNNNNIILSLVFDEQAETYREGPQSTASLESVKKITGPHNLMRVFGRNFANQPTKGLKQRAWELPLPTEGLETSIRPSIQDDGSKQAPEVPFEAVQTLECGNRVYLISRDDFRLSWIESTKFKKGRFIGILQMACLGGRLVWLDERGVHLSKDEGKEWIAGGAWQQFIAFEISPEASMLILYGQDGQKDAIEWNYGSKRVLEAEGLVSRRILYCHQDCYICDGQIQPMVRRVLPTCQQQCHSSCFGQGGCSSPDPCSCPSDQVMDGNNCVSCGPNCTSCTAVGACTGCTAGHSGATCQPVVCGGNEILVGSTCENCGPNCTSCTAVGACTGCTAGHSGATCQPVVCGGNEILVGSTCENCGPNCTSCTAVGACTGCTAGHSGATCQPVVCGGNEILVGSTCENCGPNCTSCTAVGACTGCTAGHSGATCQPVVCGGNEILVGSTCENCGPNCTSCTAVGACTGCTAGHSGATCQPVVCGGNEILVGSTCENCGPNCTSCTAVGACTGCTAGHSGATCQPVVCGGNEILVGSTCENCGPNCTSCTAVGACTGCTAGHSGATCQPVVCGGNQILVGSTCESCDSNCLTCSGAITTCTTCTPGKTVVSGACVNCTSPCVECAGLASTCTSCIANYTLASGVCSPNACPSNQTFVSGSCQNCDASCLTCSGAITTCTTCTPGKTVVSGACVNCTSPCVECAGLASTCTSCIANYTLASGVCSPNACPSNQTFVSGSCQNCDASCLTCSGAITTCTTCTPGKTVVSGACVNCTSPCVECAGLASTCTSCIANYTLASGVCSPNACPSNQTFVSGSCLERLSCQGPVLTALLHVLNALDWPRPALHASPITRSLPASARQTPVLRTRPSSAGAVKTAMPAASHARVPSPLAPHALLERLSCQGPVLTALLHVLNALDWPRPALHASPITRSLPASARQTPVLRTRPSSAGAVKTAMPAASHARVPSPLAPHALLERLSCQGPVLTALLHVLNALDWPRPALHASPITRSLPASARQTPVLRTRPSSAGAVKTAMPAASHARVPSPLAPHALLERLSCQGPVLTALLHVLNALDRPRPALHASPITRSLLASARQTPVLRTRPSSAGAVKTAMPAASHARVPSPLAPHALLERLSCQGPVLTALLHVLNALDRPRPALHASPITRSLLASARQTPVLRTRPSSAGAVKTAMPAASHARVPSPLAPHALLERLSCQGPVLTALLHVLNALDWPRPALHASPITRSLLASARQTPVLRTRPSSAGAVKTAMPAASHARVPSPLAPHALLERLSCQGPVLTALLHVLNALDWPRPALHASPITRSLPASARQTPVLRTRPSSAGAVKTAMPAASHARVPSPLAPHALLERLSCQGPVLTALLHVLNALDWPRPALHASLIISSLGHHAI
jgi:hypothetical protein